MLNSVGYTKWTEIVFKAHEAKKVNGIECRLGWFQTNYTK